MYGQTINFNAGIITTKVAVPATGAAADVAGTATLSGGTVTVLTTAITASSKIFLSVNTPSGGSGVLSAPSASIVPGVSFVINSSVGGDNATVNWFFVN